MSAALARVLVDPEGRRRLGDAARSMVFQRHTAQSMATSYGELYRQLVSPAVGT